MSSRDRESSFLGTTFGLPASETLLGTFSCHYEARHSTNPSSPTSTSPGDDLDQPSTPTSAASPSASSSPSPSSSSSSTASASSEGIQGRMFVTRSFVCFSASKEGHRPVRVAVRLVDVLDVAKTGKSGVLAMLTRRGIVLTDRKATLHHFDGVSSRNDALRIITERWRSAKAALALNSPPQGGAEEEVPQPAESPSPSPSPLPQDSLTVHVSRSGRPSPAALSPREGADEDEDSESPDGADEVYHVVVQQPARNQAVSPRPSQHDAPVDDDDEEDDDGEDEAKVPDNGADAVPGSPLPGASPQPPAPHAHSPAADGLVPVRLEPAPAEAAPLLRPTLPLPDPRAPLRELPDRIEFEADLPRYPEERGDDEPLELHFDSRLDMDVERAWNMLFADNAYLAIVDFHKEYDPRARSSRWRPLPASHPNYEEHPHKAQYVREQEYKFPIKGNPNPFGPKETRIIRESVATFTGDDSGNIRRIQIASTSMTLDTPYWDYFFNVELVTLDTIVDDDGEPVPHSCVVRNEFQTLFTQNTRFKGMIRSRSNGGAKKKHEAWLEAVQQYAGAHEHLCLSPEEAAQRAKAAKSSLRKRRKDPKDYARFAREHSASKAKSERPKSSGTASKRYLEDHFFSMLSVIIAPDRIKSLVAFVAAAVVILYTVGYATGWRLLSLNSMFLLALAGWLVLSHLRITRLERRMRMEIGAGYIGVAPKRALGRRGSGVHSNMPHLGPEGQMHLDALREHWTGLMHALDTAPDAEADVDPHDFMQLNVPALSQELEDWQDQLQRHVHE